MTTVIACRPLGRMIADTRISHGEVKFKSTKKAQHIGAFLVGVAGDYSRCLEYLKVFAKHAKKLDGTQAPKLPAAEGEGDLELVVMSAHGMWLYTEDGSPIEIEEPFYATGAGGRWAAAALGDQKRLIAKGLLQQFDLEIAMDVACEFDEATGLPLVSLSLSDPPKPRQRKRQGQPA
jgi:ATP-dependent protease HslVU (ClpYQ) peptidase subunit